MDCHQQQREIKKMKLHKNLKWQTIVDRLNKDGRFGEFRINLNFIYKYDSRHEAFLPCCNKDMTSKYEFINNTCNW